MEHVLLIIAMVVIVFLLPCKFDPAIRLKEYNERDKINKN